MGRPSCNNRGVTRPPRPEPGKAARKGWRDHAASLGSPIYGLAGQQPHDKDFGASRRGEDTTAVSLRFGTYHRMVIVETSTEPINERSLLIGLLLSAELTYPITISERTVAIEVEGSMTEFRTIYIDDDLWCGVAQVGRRWLHLRSLNVRPGDVKVEPLAL